MQLTLDFSSVATETIPSSAPFRTEPSVRDWRAESELTKDLVRLASDLQSRFAGRRGKGSGLFGLRRRYRDLYDVYREDLPSEWLAGQLEACAGLWVYQTAVVRWLEAQGWMSPRLGGPESDAWWGFHLEHNWKGMNARANRHGAFIWGLLPTSTWPMFGDFWTSTISPMIYGPSPDEDDVERLVAFWRGRPVPSSFGVPGETSYVGDLYQHLSTSSRKSQALVQTPEFVAEFILDRTLEPAIAEFGADGFRMIDPTCGTGHFLVASFRRIAREWRRNDATLTREEVARRSLGSVFGVDINPFAVDLARWRLKTAAMTYCGLVGWEWMINPPKWVEVAERNVQWADSLLPHDSPLQPFAQDVHDAHLGPTRDEPR
jgi:hypothetical protein